jgi:hypothetical protein
MVKLANAVRTVVYSPDSVVNAVFSTRTIVNWAHYLMVFGLHAKGRDSLNFVFKGSVDADSTEAVEDIIQQVFDRELELPVKDIIAKYAVKKR